MGSSEFVGYCSFTKAIEHLGDRWSLLIVRELGMFGPQGFNDLATGLPGRISRSVLADRLRRLETLGLVSRRDAPDPHPAYRLTAVGQGLMATLGSLRAWADTWLPDDPDMLERDPDIVLGWLAQRVDPDRVPDGQSSWSSGSTIDMTEGTGSCCSAVSSRTGVSPTPSWTRTATCTWNPRCRRSWRLPGAGSTGPTRWRTARSRPPAIPACSTG